MPPELARLDSMPGKAARTAWNDSSCRRFCSWPGRVGAGEVAHHHDRLRLVFRTDAGRIGERLVRVEADPVHARVDVEREGPRAAFGPPVGDLPVRTGDRDEIGGGVERTAAGEVAVEDEDPGVGREPAGFHAFCRERHEEVPAAFGVERRHDVADAEPVAVGLDDAAGGPPAAPQATASWPAALSRSIVSRPPAPASRAGVVATPPERSCTLAIPAP